MKVVVTGGAGFIGSHMVRALLRGGHEPLVIDDLSAGHEQAVPAGVRLLRVDVANRPQILEILRGYEPAAVFHFASRIQVGESIAHPRLYYTGNLAASIALLESALDAGVRHFILSSTAAVYGAPIRVPMDETHPTVPINPYGETKLAIERILEAYAAAYGLRFAALRYFNAAGADGDCPVGERHSPETHLIPIVLDAAAERIPAVTVHGADYDTPDGTCIRDYVHVSDLCDAHLAALHFLMQGGASGAFNLGTGVGHSVKEVISVAQRVTGRPIRVIFGPRRPGDPPRLVASAERAAEVLGWRARRGSLRDIVADAWMTRRLEVGPRPFVARAV